MTGAPTPIGLSGTYTIENTGDTVVSPLDALQVGTKVANTLVLDVPLAVRTQVPQLPPQVTGTFTEYIRFAPDGSWYSLGYDGTDIWSGSNQTYYAWASPPVKLREPEMAAGQVIQNPTVDMLADDLTTVLLQRQLTRATANATEVLHTPMGMLECYVVTDTETLTIDTAGAPPPPIVYRRWERPDYGVLRLELDAISYTTEYNMQPLTVTLRNVVCVLRSLTP